MIGLNMRLLTAALGAAFLMLAGCGERPAYAHDHWISQQRLVDPVSGEWCCGTDDCQVEVVEETVGGYRVLTGEVIPASRVIWKSPDGLWRRCRYLSGDKAGKTRCLVGVPPGS